MKFKIGDKVRPKNHPELKGKIVDMIDTPFVKDSILIEKTLYILDWGGRYFEDELDNDIMKSMLI